MVIDQDPLFGGFDPLGIVNNADLWVEIPDQQQWLCKLHYSDVS